MVSLVLDMHENNPVDPSDVKFKARNWKELSKKQLQGMTTVQRSRYLAYEPSPDQKGISRCQSRLNAQARAAAKQAKDIAQETSKEESACWKQKTLEARVRVQDLHKCHRTMRAAEICHLISMQPSAIKAVRLESLLPPIYEPVQLKDTVKRRQRSRIEALMEDEHGIETERLLSS